MNNRLALYDTLGFVSSALAGCHRLLEVGAGEGLLAGELADLGFDVTALDARTTPAAHPGVRGVRADFISYDDRPFDALLFTSSLHHLWPLERAMTQARKLTAPGGLVVVDDFDFAAIDADSARWYYETGDLLALALRREPAARASDDPLERWRIEHHEPGDPLLPGRVMLTALSSAFSEVSCTRGAYLYRHLVHALGDDRADLAAFVQATELARIGAGALTPIGLRFVGRR